MRLLLLEDDLMLGEGLRDYLRSDGYLVEWFTRIGDVRGLAQEPFDVLLLDWNLPDGSGVAWLAKLRAQGQSTPAIIMTARDQLGDRISGLDSGADDYLVKPFAPEELAARLRALGRRMSGAKGARWVSGEVSVDLATNKVWVGDKLIELTAREWAILEALLLRSGRIVSKVDLDALVNGFDGESNSNSLEVHISRLRRKLDPDLIETVRGMGYRIVAA